VSTSYNHRKKAIRKANGPSSKVKKARKEKLLRERSARVKARGIQQINIKKKIGRNDPCICGSGLKYKKCCLNKEVTLDVDTPTE